MAIGGAGSPAGAPVLEIGLYGGAIIGAILALGAVLVAMRRLLHGHAARGGRTEDGLSIEQVQRLHRAGAISDEEFASLRRGALGLGARAAGRDKGIMHCAKGADENTEPGQG